MDLLFWGAIVRMSQAAVAACPTIVVGWIVAAVFERILGREGTLKLFGGHTWRQLPYAWLLGMLLPVCSLGVIPFMVQMRKSGIAGGTILAFGLTAPLFNPISVLYGLTLSDPVAIFVFCMCTEHGSRLNHAPNLQSPENFVHGGNLRFRVGGVSQAVELRYLIDLMNHSELRNRIAIWHHWLAIGSPSKKIGLIDSIDMNIG